MRLVVECSKSRKNPHGFDPNSKALAVLPLKGAHIPG